MTTRKQLLEELAAAETNLAIARQQMETFHTAYLLACDLVSHGSAPTGTADAIYADYEDAARHKRACWHTVDTLKAQLLERDEIAAALNEAKAGMVESRARKLEVGKPGR